MALLLATSLGACGSSEPALQRGQELFHSNSFSTSTNNSYSCSTCHATDPADARRYSGYLLAGAPARPTWWGGQFEALLDAVNQCRTHFMQSTPLSADDLDGRALLVYLESLTGTGGDAKAQPFQVVANLDRAYLDSLSGGDANRGQALYSSACAPCHGTTPLHSTRALAVEKVRHGNFFLVGGTMPLYSTEALLDKELADLLTSLGY